MHATGIATPAPMPCAQARPAAGWRGDRGCDATPLHCTAAATRIARPHFLPLAPHALLCASGTRPFAPVPAAGHGPARGGSNLLGPSPQRNVWPPRCYPAGACPVAALPRRRRRIANCWTTTPFHLRSNTRWPGGGGPPPPRILCWHPAGEVNALPPPAGLGTPAPAPRQVLGPHSASRPHTIQRGVPSPPPADPPPCMDTL